MPQSNQTTRPLKAAEIERFNSCEANEARCNAKGTHFGSYDIHQEGYYIMASGRYLHLNLNAA